MGIACLINYNHPMTEHEPGGEEQVVALRFRDYSMATWRKLTGFFKERNTGYAIDSDSNSIIVDREIGEALKATFDVDDVTDMYARLKSLTEGYQVLRIGSTIELENGQSLRGPERIIKDHSTGIYFITHGFEGPMPITHDYLLRDRLASGAFELVPEEGGNGPEIFATMEEALEAYL